MRDGKITIARLYSRYDGAVHSRVGVIMGLNPARYETICVYLMKSSEKPNFFREKGCRVFYISSKKYLRMFNLWVIWKLSRVLKREGVDILHCHRHQATIYGTIAAKIAAVPIVFSHVHGISRTKNWRRRLINFVVLRWVNKILTVGEPVKEDVLRTNSVVQPEQVISLGNSIEYDRFVDVQISKERVKESLALPQNSFVFGTVARMAPNKGHIYLIRAFGKVKQVLPSAHLVFVGDGRLKNELEARAAKTAPDSIHFLGRRDDISELLRAMDVYVQPSIGSEGLPRGLLEAMAAGVPCIGTQVSGIPEILDDGEDGYLVPPKDDNALAEAMLKLTKVPELERKQLVEKAKNKVRTDFGHSIIIKRLESIYETEISCCCEADRG